MKISTKTSSKQAVDVLTTTAGVVVGAKTSKGVKAISPIDNPTANRVAVIALGAALALFTKGNGKGASFVRGSGVGMMVQEAGDALKEALSGKLPDNEFLNAAFDQMPLAVAEAKRALAGYRKKRSLAYPDSTFQMGTPMTSFVAG